jgi:D-inositol-3-phosphate glycosyltransferase
MTDTPRRNGRPPLRIVEVETFGRGGLIHYAWNLCEALAGRGHDVTLVTAAGYELDARSLPPGVSLRRILSPASHGPPSRLPSMAAALVRKVEAFVDAWRVARLVWRLRPDVVHLHSTNQIALAYLILLRAIRARIVVTAHVVTAHERTTIQDAIHRAIHRLSPRIVAHSAFDRERLIRECGVDQNRVAVIPHGEYGFFERDRPAVDRLEARRSLGLDPDDEVVLFFGYIREYKGLDVLLGAWPAVAAARPRARLVIAGDPVRLPPSRRTWLETAASRLGAIHRFEYVPFSEVPRYFAAADLLALPYRHVSQSGVLFLALGLGLPVVATRVGALPEVLTDGENGLLVSPEAPAELASAIVRALEDDALRERLAQGGRRSAERYRWPSIAERTEALFDSLDTVHRRV